jgi:uncharacterized protein (UPF0335 family)
MSEGKELFEQNLIDRDYSGRIGRLESRVEVAMQMFQSTVEKNEQLEEEIGWLHNEIKELGKKVFSE